MLTFEYEARNSATGEKVKSQVQADNERAAAKVIREQGLSPVSIKQLDTSKQGFFKKITSKDKVLFARQLSTLINAGLPLVQSLRMVQRQTTSKSMQAVIGEVIGDVEAGKSFGDSLEKHPTVFNNVFVNLIKAGEISGTLDKSLERLADQQEKDAEILAKVRGAMVYPLVVLFVMVAVTVFMLVTVLPQVKVLYDGLPGAQLPLITQVLLAVSTFLQKFWWLFLILMAFFVIYLSKWGRTVAGKSFVDGLKLHVKPLNELFMKVYMARFSRTAGTLVATGVPLLQTLDIVSKAVNNVHIEASINRAIVKVKGGKGLADSLEGDPNFLELVPNMLRIGEQSGSIEQMLNRTADYYEKEVDNQIKTINTIIEPVMMIVLGIVALTIVAAVLLPIYGLAGQDLSK